MTTATEYPVGTKVRIKGNDHEPYHYLQHGATAEVASLSSLTGLLNVRGPGIHVDTVSQYVNPLDVEPVYPEAEAVERLTDLADLIDERSTELVDAADKAAEVLRKLAEDVEHERQSREPVQGQDDEEHAFRIGQEVRVKADAERVATDRNLAARPGVVYTVQDDLIDSDGEIELATATGERRTKWAFPSALEPVELAPELGARVRVRESVAHILPEGTEAILVAGLGKSAYHTVATAEDVEDKYGRQLPAGLRQAVTDEEYEVIAPPHRDPDATRVMVVGDGGDFHGFPAGTIGSIERAGSVMGWSRVVADEPQPSTKPGEFSPEVGGKLLSQLLREQDYVTL